MSDDIRSNFLFIHIHFAHFTMHEINNFSLRSILNLALYHYIRIIFFFFIAKNHFALNLTAFVFCVLCMFFFSQNRYEILAFFGLSFASFAH